MIIQPQANPLINHTITARSTTPSQHNLVDLTTTSPISTATPTPWVRDHHQSPPPPSSITNPTTPTLIKPTTTRKRKRSKPSTTHTHGQNPSPLANTTHADPRQSCNHGTHANFTTHWPTPISQPKSSTHQQIIATDQPRTNQSWNPLDPNPSNPKPSQTHEQSITTDGSAKTKDG